MNKGNHFIVICMFIGMLLGLAITWSWADYPEEWSISKNWWKSDWIIKYLSYVKAIRGRI